MAKLPPRTLWLASYRYALRHPLLLTLTLLGLASGVAIVIAVDIATRSAQHQLDQTVAALYGEATHQIVGGPQGIDQALFVELKRRHGLHQASPVISGFVFTRPADPLSLQVLGVDPFSEASFRSYINASLSDPRRLTDFLTTPNGVLLSPASAQALGVTPGERFEVYFANRSAELVVLDYLAADPALDQLMITDIANAQTLFALEQRITRIDLKLTDTTTPAQLQQQLPVGVQLIDSRQHQSAVHQLTQAFRTNLRAMSLLAVLIGGFVVFTTVRFSVLQRLPYFGLYRVMGVTGAELRRLVLTEVLLLSLLASLLGVIGGAALAQGLLGLITQTFADHYGEIHSASLALSPLSLLKALGLGILVALLTAWFPARQAAKVQPISLTARVDTETAFLRITLWAAPLGALCLVGGLTATLLSTSLTVAFGGLFFCVAGYALLLPRLLLGLNRALGAVLRWRSPLLVLLALRDVSRSLSRTGIAIVALVIALGATIGLSLMVGSFRVAVADWMSHTLRADIYVSLPDRLADPPTAGFTAQQIAALTALPGVRTYSQGRRTLVRSERGQHELRVLQLPVEGFAGFRFLQGDDAQLYTRFSADDVVLVSEPYAYRHALQAGDTLPLLTTTGWRAFVVAAVYRDYSTEQGLITISQQSYERHWSPLRVTTLGLYLAQGVSEQGVLDVLRRQFATAQNLSIRSRSKIRELSLTVFDRTFAITQVLQILILGVAVITLVVTLLSWQLEQRRELAVARAIGFLPGQLQRKLAVQSLVMGLHALILAIPLGALLAALLVYVINQRAFGWSMELILEAGPLWSAGLAALLAALLAAAYPAYQLRQDLPRAALQERA